MTNGLFESKFLVHFWNNRLLRWPRFLFWNSFPLSCRAQILTKRSLMAFLLFKTSQSSTSHPQLWVELCGEYSFQPSHPHKSQNCSFKTQFRKQTLCLEYSEPTKKLKDIHKLNFAKKWIYSWRVAKLPLSVTLTKHLFFLRRMKNKWLYDGDASFALPPVSERKDYVDAFLPKAADRSFAKWLSVNHHHQH